MLSDCTSVDEADITVVRTYQFYKEVASQADRTKIQKGMYNLKYLLPSDGGILQFLSNSNEIWSRDQFFQKNQLCFCAGMSFGVK